MRRRLLLAVAAFLVLAIPVSAREAPSAIPSPGAKDLCPVCGMLVSKYPSWVATVLYKDGSVHHFDGPKDLFKYLQAMPRYASGHRAEDIQRVAVTDFYDLQKIDGRKAFYVIGSDVLGPMGHELVPLATQADAEEFLKDHKGKRILRFEQVTAAILDGLELRKND